MIKHLYKKIIVSLVIILNLCYAKTINVDPPNWWTHFNDRKLELMVYGESIGKTETVKVFNDNKEIETQIVIEAIKKTDNYNYLFIELRLLDELIPKVISSLRSSGVFILESSPREFSIPPTRVKDYGDSQLTFWENN